MAYQAKQRDPFLDSTTTAAIERRGKELLGIGLLALGVLAACILGSYVPDDPSWMSATDEPARNLLGKFGASIASPLFIIIGFGGWGLVALFLAWGLRFTFHYGEERAISRLIFAPIAIALGSIYASTLGPNSAWTHSFGLGGLFGDTVLGALVNILPISASFGVKLIAAPVGLAALALGIFVLGGTLIEVKRVARFLLVGVIMTYATLMNILGQSARGTAHAAVTLKERRAAARENDTVLIDESDEFSATPLVMPAEPTVTRKERSGLFSQMTGFGKRPVEPELVETLPEIDELEAPEEDRIKARIADAIKVRARKGHATAAMRAEPPVIRPETIARARRPEPLIVKTPGAVMPAPMAELSVEDDAPVVALQSSEPATPQVLQRAVIQHPPRKTVQPSKKAKAEAQPALAFEESGSDFELPPLSLLASPETIERHHLSDEALEENARMLENVLDDYGVKGEIVSVRPGPVVTMYELEPAPGLKASRVIGLADDIARSMAALSARVSTVPGRSVIGIELPNVNREKVVLREILSARDFGDSSMRLPLALGKDIGGESMVANLAKMPHLLIAGTTGSGKSVAINTMILSLLYRLRPDECRMIMIDPKMLELSVYDGIPHLLSPVVTDPKKAVVALKWVVGEMEDRYRKMSKMGVRNIEGYNGRVREALANGEMFSRTVQTGFDDDTGEPIFETEEFAPEALPFIVVIVDEMADLMMVAGKEIEACIQRLAQMARASGIHLIMATQRPSVDVITGTIKANFPTRISFQVTSKIDSRTILGEMGAEQLLGMGDMLYMAGGGKITRCHGPFVSDEEVEEIVNHLKGFGAPDYIGGVVDGPDDDKESSIDAVLGLGGNTNGEDALYDQAVAIVIRDRKCSTSYIQRKLAIGYNKAARLVEQMEDEGLISSSNHVGKREVLVPEQ